MKRTLLLLFVLLVVAMATSTACAAVITAHHPALGAASAKLADVGEGAFQAVLFGPGQTAKMDAKGTYTLTAIPLKDMASGTMRLTAQTLTILKPTYDPKSVLWTATLTTKIVDHPETAITAYTTRYDQQMGAAFAQMERATARSHIVGAPCGTYLQITPTVAQQASATDVGVIHSGTLYAVPALRASLVDKVAAFDILKTTATAQSTIHAMDASTHAGGFQII